MESTAQKLYFDPSCFSGKTIIFCLPGRSFSNKFLMAWTQLFAECNKYGIIVHYTNKYSSNVYYVRNSCLGGNVLSGKNQKPYQGKVKYDFIAWIDSDIVFTTDQFFYMLYESIERENIKIMSGLYLMENAVQYAAVQTMDFEYFKRNGTFEFIKKGGVPESQFFEADYIGFGFVLIKYGVFEELNYPWFSPLTIKIPDTNIQDFCSEDVGFCLKIAKKGIKIHIARSVIVKHEKMICL